MSRCKACDKIMSDSEMVRRDAVTNDYSELCTLCTAESDVLIDEGMNDEYFINQMTRLLDPIN